MTDFPKESLLGVSISMDILKTYALKTHTVRGRLTLKDVERFLEQVGPRIRFIMGSLFVNNIIYRTLCFMKTVLQRFICYTLTSRTNAYAVRGRPTIKNVELFGMDRRSTNL